MISFSSTLAAIVSPVGGTPTLTDDERQRGGHGGALPQGKTRLGPYFGQFFQHLSPKLLLAGLVISFVTRLVLGGWSLWDAVIPVALVLLQPLTEWNVHVFLLHWRPRKIGPFTLDTHLAQKHRLHHQDPSSLKHVWIPTRSLLFVIAFNALAWSLLAPTWGLAFTGLSATFAIGLVYEWTHYIVHTDYRPQSDFYKRVWRHHRWHHYKNENYWFGVTMHAGDKLLSTAPEPGSVPLSPTARDLLGRPE